MSLLRNSVIVGGATFLVGSAFMEIGKADSKSDIGKWPYIATFLSGALGFYLLKQNFIPVPKALELNADYYDNYGDMEYILLEMLTDEQLEAEYGDYMREHQNGPLSRDDLPTALDNDYRTDEEAPYLRKKYFDEEYHAEYDFKNHAVTTVVADDEDEAWDNFAKGDEAWQQWEIIDVREAELNADSDNIIRFKVGEQYTHEYHHGYLFRDNEIMRRTDKTVWTSQVNPETGKVDYPLLVSQHRIYTKQPFELDGEIVSGYESYGLGNDSYGVTAGDTSLRTYDAEYMEEELMVGSHDFDDGSMMVGIGTDVDDPDFMEMMIDADGDIEYFSLPIGEGGWMRSYKVKPSHYGKLKTQNETNDTAGGDFVRFAAEVFEADRKIRRRTRWTWTRGQESGFEVENDDISELPYDIDYSGQKGRGWKSQYVPLYSIEDSYHISDLPEGYHLHLYKPSVRSGEWRAFSKSPTSEDWNEYRNYKKSNLTGELLTWYNQDIAKPEEKTLSPIEKLMISKGLKSGTIQIERVVIPSTNYTNEKVQYFALGGPRNMSPTKFCEIEGGVISLENLTSNESNLFAFGQGLKFMTERTGTLRSVNRFNKNPEAWVKSYPAWFQNAVKNKLTDINVKFTDENEYDGGMRINGFRVLKFLNGASRYSWQGINESKRKVIDTPYGEMPQFEIYELDMNDPAPIIPRPSTMRKIYAKSFKQNLGGDWKFDEEMFMMAVVDKYKFENGGSEKIHNSMVDEPLYSIDIIPYMTPMAELMARRYKKKE